MGAKMSGKVLSVAFALAAVVAFLYANAVEAQHVKNGPVAFWDLDEVDVGGKAVENIVGKYEGAINGDCGNRYWTQAGPGWQGAAESVSIASSQASISITRERGDLKMSNRTYKTLTDSPERHVIIDRRQGHYLCFPDVGLTASGRLIVVYREAEKHAAKRSKLLLKSSDDLGRSWSAPLILNASRGHCPRISRLSDDQMVIIDDASRSLYWSMDEGRTWAIQPNGGFRHGAQDRIIELDKETFLTTGHAPRGTFRYPVTAGPTTEQMVYKSENRGRDWKPLAVLAYDKNLVLCEGSITRLPDGRLLALLREDSRVYEPMYKSFSGDNGNTWSDPEPTPMIGHRPCVGVTQSGKILVTYRNVAPNGGTVAWLGTLDELDDFKVHGLSPSKDNPVLTDEGLMIENESGKDACVLYALRPLTSPVHAKASLEAEVQVFHAEENACGIHFGVWWRIFADHIKPGIENVEAVPLESGRPNRLRLEFEDWQCTLYVNGEKKMSCKIDPMKANAARRILFGNISEREKNGGRSLWKSLRLRIEEPRYGRTYEWNWNPQNGLPDEYARTRVLELKNDRFASMGDFGYSGWVQLPDGDFLCVYHHGGGTEPGYKHGATSYVVGTRFNEADFE